MPLPSAASEPEAWLRLTLTPGLGSERLRALLRAFGSPDEVLRQSTASLAQVVPAKVAAALKDGTQAPAIASAMNWLAAPDQHLMTLADADYPPLLVQTPDPPAVLYIKGGREWLSRPALAIVGSRNATPQGLDNARAFARSLADAGLTIVSGLALGIDAAAHAGGLAGAGRSVAVVGTGLDRVYPARNRALARELAAEGALVSEFALGTPSMAANFPRRNRIISGLARGCLVVEAAISSGSLITARLAGEQGREVFAIPGSIHSPFSKGCHQLIKQGAKLVESAQDVLEELQLGGTAPRASAATVPTATPDDPVLVALGYDPASVDQIAARAGLSVAEVTARLVELELAGRVARLAGGAFQRHDGH